MPTGDRSTTRLPNGRDILFLPVIFSPLCFNSYGVEEGWRVLSAGNGRKRTTVTLRSCVCQRTVAPGKEALKETEPVSSEREGTTLLLK